MELNRYIDHTLLKADAVPSEIDRLCREAMEYRFASVCVNTCYVERAAELLAGSGVAVCSVVGFPLGAMETEAKAHEARRAVELGATEVDMVMSIGFAKAGDWKRVGGDMREVVEAAKPAIVKVIIETCLLTDEEKKRACIEAKAAGAAFVKTSTGFSTSGAKAADVRLMRETVGPEMGVKASGGIHTREEAIEMIEAGANRIGASSGIKIVRG